MTAAEKYIETGGQTVGKVVILYDTAKAISPDGMERVLAVGSPVYAYDRIVTEGDGRVSILIDDADQSQIDLDKMSEVLIDEDIFGGISFDEISEATAEIEQVQEAFFVDGINLTAEPEIPASNEETSAGGGHTVTDFNRVTHEGDVSNTAAQKVSVVFDHSDYTNLDSGGPGDSLDHLIDTDDSDS